MVKAPRLFFSGKIRKSFIYPSLNNTELKFQKKQKHLFQNYKVPSYLFRNFD